MDRCCNHQPGLTVWLRVNLPVRRMKILSEEALALALALWGLASTIMLMKHNYTSAPAETAPASGM